MVAYVAGPEYADRQPPMYGRPHQAFRNPFGLVVTPLQPVGKAVYQVVFLVGGIVPSWEDAVGGNVLHRLCLGAASEPEYLQCPINGVGLDRRVGVHVVDGGRAVKDHIDLLRKLPILVLLQSQMGLGKVSHNRNDSIFEELAGQPVELQRLQYTVGRPALPGSPVPHQAIEPGVVARGARQFVKQEGPDKAGCPRDQDRRCFAQTRSSDFALGANLRIQFCVVGQRSSRPRVCRKLVYGWALVDLCAAKLNPKRPLNAQGETQADQGMAAKVKEVPIVF